MCIDRKHSCLCTETRSFPQITAKKKKKKRKKEKAKFKNKRKTAIYLLLVYVPGQRNNLTILHMYSLVNLIGSYTLYASYGTIPHLSNTLSILKTGIKNYLDSWI